MEMALFNLGIVGLLLSCYALYVEHRANKDHGYKPICDISEHISCTKAFASGYGKLAGLPNPAYGVFFYLIISYLAYFDQFIMLFSLSLIAVAGSVFLAYLSYVRLRTFCVVCSSIYIVNILLLMLSWNSVF